MTCAQCGGSGILRVPDNDGMVQQCRCSFLAALRAHLGPEIASARLLKASPLYGFKPARDRTSDNLFLHGPWGDILAHLKWTLAAKGTGFTFKIVTDERLRTVYVGSESYAQRQRQARDHGEVYNSLADLIGPPELVIIRLGFLGYRNIAMPGVLKEALMLREGPGKATWLVDMPHQEYTFGHHAYSEEASMYIEANFEHVWLNLPPDPNYKPPSNPTPTPSPEPEGPRRGLRVTDVGNSDDETLSMAPEATPQRARSPKAAKLPDPVLVDEIVESMVPGGRKYLDGDKSRWGQRGDATATAKTPKATDIDQYMPPSGKSKSKSNRRSRPE